MNKTRDTANNGDEGPANRGNWGAVNNEAKGTVKKGQARKPRNNNETTFKKYRAAFCFLRWITHNAGTQQVVSCKIRGWCVCVRCVARYLPFQGDTRVVILRLGGGVHAQVEKNGISYVKDTPMLCLWELGVGVDA